MYLLVTTLYAANGAPAQGGAAPIISMLPMIIGFIAIFYFLLWRPQQKQAKEHSKMLSELKKGEMILTSGGIYGEIVGIKDDNLQIKIAANVKINILRSAIAKKIVNPEIQIQ